MNSELSPRCSQPQVYYGTGQEVLPGVILGLPGGGNLATGLCYKKEDVGVRKGFQAEGTNN